MPFFTATPGGGFGAGKIASPARPGARPGSLVPQAPQAPRLYPGTNQNTGIAGGYAGQSVPGQTPGVHNFVPQSVQNQAYASRAPTQAPNYAAPTYAQGATAQTAPTQQAQTNPQTGFPVPQGTPYQPPAYTPSQYGSRDVPQTGRYPTGYTTPSGQAFEKQISDLAQRQRDLLGPAAQWLPISPDRPLLRNDIPLLQAGLIFENRQMAEGDLQHGIDALIGGRNDVGQDPASMLAREIAMKRAQEGGQFNDAFLDQQRGAIRNRGGVANDSAIRAMAEDMARRGVQGPLAGMQAAQLQQQNALGVQGQLADFEQNAQAAREEAERAALGQLHDISSQEAAQRAAFDQAISQGYLNNQRETPDLLSLLTSVKKGKTAVGGFPENQKKQTSFQKKLQKARTPK